MSLLLLLRPSYVGDNSPNPSPTTPCWTYYTGDDAADGVALTYGGSSTSTFGGSSTFTYDGCD